MSWRSWISSGVEEELQRRHNLLMAEMTAIRIHQADVIKQLQAINQSVAKLIYQKANEPEELTNAQRAALIGLPESMADMVDWDRLERRR